MWRQLPGLTLRLALCTGATWLAWRRLGPVGVVVCTPLFGMALARPIVEGLGALPRLGRGWLWRDVEGRHAAFRGVALDVVDDADGHPWIGLAALRHLLPGLPRDDSLRHGWPDDVQRLPPGKAWRIRAERLAELLAPAQAPDTVRLRVWLERELIHPARRRREIAHPTPGPAADRPASDDR